MVNSFKLCFFMMCATVLPLILGSCGTGDDGVSQSDMLTPEETKLIVTHIRNVIVKSKGLKITDSERNLVKSTEPRVKVYCTGHKLGRMTVKWLLENERSIVVMLDGDLLDEKPNLRIKILDDISSRSLPDGTFGKQGEELALPPQ